MDSEGISGFMTTFGQQDWRTGVSADIRYKCAGHVGRSKTEQTAQLRSREGILAHRM